MLHSRQTVVETPDHLADAEDTDLSLVWGVHLSSHLPGREVKNCQGLTREQFAARFCFAKHAVKDWEQRGRQPERSARILLKVIAHDPEAVERALRAA
jgi:putative transcriptional regulator